MHSILLTLDFALLLKGVGIKGITSTVLQCADVAWSDRGITLPRRGVYSNVKMSLHENITLLFVCLFACSGKCRDVIWQSRGVCSRLYVKPNDVYINMPTDVRFCVMVYQFRWTGAVFLFGLQSLEGFGCVDQ